MKKKNRFNNQIDIHEVARTAAAMAVIFAVAGALAVWFFHTWAQQAGL